MVKTCEAILRSNPLFLPNPISDSLKSRSTSSNNIVRSKLQTFQDTERVCSQRSPATEANTLLRCKAAVNDEENAKRYASDEAKHYARQELCCHGRCTVEISCTNCRMRRIMCDEGKPTHRNCTRSQRKCEGSKAFQGFNTDDDKYLAVYTGKNIESLARRDHITPASTDYFEYGLKVGSCYSVEEITPKLSGCSATEVKGATLNRRLLDVITALSTTKGVFQSETISIIARYHPQLTKHVARVLIDLALELCRLGRPTMSECQSTVIVVQRFAKAIGVECSPMWPLQRSREAPQNDVLLKIEHNVGTLVDLGTQVQDWMDDLDAYVLVPQQHIPTCCAWHSSNPSETARIQDRLEPTSSDSQTRDLETDWALVEGPSVKYDMHISDPVSKPADRFPPQKRDFDTTGQVAPTGLKPRVTVTLWEDESTLCFTVEVVGVVVGRREDNHFINGTSLLEVACKARGRRSRNLETERIQHVVDYGQPYLRGAWIPFDRALEFANSEMITDILYPLFVHNIGALLYSPPSTGSGSLSG